MNKEEFEKTCSLLTGDSIRFMLLENQAAKKWYEKVYIKVDDLLPSTKYGVVINNDVEFDFVTTSVPDGYLKSFISQYTSKKKQVELIDGQIRQLTKKELLDRITLLNRDRVHYGLFYTALYGIGLWDFFNSKKAHDELTHALGSFLSNEGVQYSNEYSDAMWVYRFRFKVDIHQCNALLRKFRDQNADRS